jgi:hypothetical protein
MVVYIKLILITVVDVSAIISFICPVRVDVIIAVQKRSSILYLCSFLPYYSPS